jgi:hypothetical protein
MHVRGELIVALSVVCLCLCVQYAREAANRWQDNIGSLQDWCRKKFEGRENDITSFFKDQGFNEDAPYFV